MPRPALERKRYPDLRPDEVEARVRIGLTGVGEMLVKNAHVDFEVIVDQIIDPCRGQNIEGEILSLAVAKRVRAVDPAQADTARSVRLQAPAGTHEDMPKAGGEAEVMILRPLENRLGH